MNTRILPALKACLTGGLTDLHLLGQTAEGDAVQPVQVFIGEWPETLSLHHPRTREQLS